MTEHAADLIYAVRDWEDNPGLTIEVRVKYLNYDVSDGLKARLRELVQARLDGGIRHIVLDLTQVSIVDSCGVGLMIGVHNLVRDQQGTLYLTGITHFLEKIFRMMHLDQYFNIVESEAWARDHVSALA